jgi:hypothetical protein
VNLVRISLKFTVNRLRMQPENTDLRDQPTGRVSASFEERAAVRARPGPATVQHSNQGGRGAGFRDFLCSSPAKENRGQPVDPSALISPLTPG